MGGALPSVGSQGHAEGRCYPCGWVNSSGGCRNGDQCTFCHFKHTHKGKQKMSKKRRDRQHKWAAQQFAKLSMDPDALQEVTASLPTMLSQTRRSQMIQQFRDHADAVREQNVLAEQSCTRTMERRIVSL